MIETGAPEGKRVINGMAFSEELGEVGLEGCLAESWMVKENLVSKTLEVVTLGVSP